MAVTKWLMEFSGKQWGADGTTITPPVLAEHVQKHAGEARITYYGKPYTLDPADAQSVYDYFDSDIDPQGLRKRLVWEAEPDSQEWYVQA